MTTDTSMETSSSKGTALSLDTWALIVAFVLALAVRFDILKNVPWWRTHGKSNLVLTEKGYGFYQCSIAREVG